MNAPSRSTLRVGVFAASLGTVLWLGAAGSAMPAGLDGPTRSDDSEALSECLADLIEETERFGDYHEQLLNQSPNGKASRILIKLQAAAYRLTVKSKECIVFPEHGLTPSECKERLEREGERLTELAN